MTKTYLRDKYNSTIKIGKKYIYTTCTFTLRSVALSYSVSFLAITKGTKFQGNVFRFL